MRKCLFHLIWFVSLYSRFQPNVINCYSYGYKVLIMPEWRFQLLHSVLQKENKTKHLKTIRRRNYQLHNITRVFLFKVVLLMYSVFDTLYLCAFMCAFLTGFPLTEVSYDKILIFLLRSLIRNIWFELSCQYMIM